MINRLATYWTAGRRPEDESETAGPAAWLDWLETQLGRSPAATLGVGLLLGVTLGWLIKRR
ncbi:MAG: hypothetical protein KY476_13005 [Planctomycetes bacterium]|nr:hypothetical protein [Planctomycetota bacterium]